MTAAIQLTWNEAAFSSFLQQVYGNESKKPEKIAYAYQQLFCEHFHSKILSSRFISKTAHEPLEKIVQDTVLRVRQYCEKTGHCSDYAFTAKQLEKEIHYTGIIIAFQCLQKNFPEFIWPSIENEEKNEQKFKIITDWCPSHYQNLQHQILGSTYR